MRRNLPVFFFLVSTSALAQPSTHPLGQFERFEADLRAQAIALKRDASIVSQAMAAIGSLEDFQPNTAIQKALDRIEAAQVRAGEKPAASPRTQASLAGMHAELVKARLQGTMVDMRDLRRELLRRAVDMQAMLARDFNEIRKQRQILADLQTRVARLTTEVDDSMGEALSAAFENARTGRN
jgi:hypothetical protein